MNKVRYGIVGMGNQGSYYASLICSGQIEDAVLTAVCDNNPEKLAPVAQKYGENIARFDSFDEMIDSGLFDALLIEVPHYFHPEMAVKALERNINVICEKPAGVYTRQVKEMNRAAEKSKALFAMMFNQRTDCRYRKMREIVQGGGIGELQRVTWIITDWFRTETYYRSGTWRGTWDGEGGGVLFNQCPHQLDLISWIVGENPVAVNGYCKYGKWHDVEVEDDVTAYLEYRNGASGMFITTTGEAPGTNRLEISGTMGKLLCENGKLLYYKNAEDSQSFCKTSSESFCGPKCEVTEPETDGESPQHKGILQNFTNALLGREELFVSGTEGINGVELMNAIELSGWKNGERVSIPVDEDEYLRELNKRRGNS